MLTLHFIKPFPLKIRKTNKLTNKRSTEHKIRHIYNKKEKKKENQILLNVARYLVYIKVKQV